MEVSGVRGGPSGNREKEGSVRGKATGMSTLEKLSPPARYVPR